MADLAASEREMIMLVPSVFGPAIIQRFRLVCGKGRDEAYLEKLY